MWKARRLGPMACSVRGVGGSVERIALRTLLVNPIVLIPNSALDAMTDFVRPRRRLFVLSGAGCSTASGIPDYRDGEGRWKQRMPVTHQAFVSSEQVRQRYWWRSMIGWQRFSQAMPNAAHRALARLENDGWILQLVTQNVDGLHQRAGSRRVIDLHGRLDRVVCLDCGRVASRTRYQAKLEQCNSHIAGVVGRVGPDGDADVDDANVASVRVPGCPLCGGVVKPDVVFFGDAVPRPRVERVRARIEASDGVLVIGSSLMVFSGYRFVRHALESGKPVAAINLGRTRADAELTLKLEADCGTVLEGLVHRLSGA